MMTRLHRPGRALAAAALALALAAPPAATALDLEAMTDAERAAFGEAVRAYLLENPQVIMEAVEALEARQAEARSAADRALVAAHAEALYDDGVSWVGGNPDGDVTVVEFLDYRCGYCRRAFPEVEELLATDGNIKLIVKEFPILGPDSVLASRFAIAVRNVAGPEAYKTVHDRLMMHDGEVNPAALARIARQGDLDAEAIMAAMEAPEVTQELRDNRALAQDLEINGTPSFVLGGELVRGYVPLPRMMAMVEAARAEE